MTEKSTLTVIHNPQVDAAHADIVVCHRIADLPIPNSPASQQACTRCAARIWVGQRAPTNVPKVCHPCAVDLARAYGKPVTVLVGPGTPGPEAQRTRDDLLHPPGNCGRPICSVCGGNRNAQ